ncbi:MAG: tRNA lysidine(34) synthetase TilS, partial [Planctomycetota bacterium]
MTEQESHGSSRFDENSLDPFFIQIKDSIDRIDVPPRARWLVACSGGADSTALCLALHRLLPAGAELVVAHVHHGIRGEEADRDERFVFELSERLDLRFVSDRVSVPEAVDELGEAPELVARELRYHCIRRWCVDLEVDVVALAHHRDDQRETVLLRLARGSGWRGLVGMREARKLDRCDRDVDIVRPLLSVTREEIVAWLENHNEPYRDDATNFEPHCARNRVRLNVLPELERSVHPGVRVGLDRLSRIAGELHADLSELADRAVRDAKRDSGRLDARILSSWPRSVLRAVLDRCVSDLAAELPSANEEAFERFVSLLLNPGSTRVEDLGM